MSSLKHLCGTHHHDVYSAVAAAAYAAAASNSATLVNNEALSDGTINALDITQVSDQWNNY